MDITMPDFVFVNFLSEHFAALQQKTIEHIFLSGLSLLIASFMAIPLGIAIFRCPTLRKMILPLGSISQTIPSLAMLGFLIPIFGLGTVPTLLVLIFYAIYPLLKSTDAGLKAVPAECLEAAEGMGFSTFQKLWFVELPLAFPVIISGLRVATAMTIGITSIAAFIGAGGLGDFIMQGLALNDSSLILLGAIPTALLALGFDFAISQVEAHLHHRKAKLLKRNRSYLMFFAVMIFIGGSAFYYTKSVHPKEHSIVIASKNFTESLILAEMMAQAIEMKTSLKVIRKFNLGTTDIIHQAMVKGEVDLYPEYTGTAYLTILKKTPPPEGGSLFQKVKLAYKDAFNLIWLAPFGFSNSQALAIGLDYAKRHQIHTLSDLARLSQTLTIAAPPEFLKRPDGLPGLLKAYGLTFKNIIQVDPNLMYLAIKNKTVDIIAAFSTDGKLQQHNLITLVDDKNFYPSYEAAPVVREAILKTHPEVSQALAPLLGTMGQQVMMDLNYQVDVEGKSPGVVVQQVLSNVDRAQMKEKIQ